MASVLYQRLRAATSGALTRPEKKAEARDNKAQADARVTAKVTNMGLFAADSKTGQVVSTRKMQRAVIPLCFANDEVRKTAFTYAIGSSLSLDALYEKYPDLQALSDETMAGPDSALPPTFVVELFNVLRLPAGQIDGAYKRIRFAVDSRLNPTGNKGILVEQFIDFDADLQNTFQDNKKLCKALGVDRLVLFFVATCLLDKNAVEVIALTRSGRHATDAGRAAILKVLQRHNGYMWNNRSTDTIEILDRRNSTAQSWYQLLKHLGEGDAAYVMAPSAEVLDGSVDPYSTEDQPTRGASAAAPAPPTREGDDEDSSFVSGDEGEDNSSAGLSGFETDEESDGDTADEEPVTTTTASATTKTKTTTAADGDSTTTVETVEQAAEESEKTASRIAGSICVNSCDYHDRHIGSPLALCPDACVSSRVGAALKQGRTTHKGKSRDKEDHARAQRRTIESMTRTMPKSQRVVMRDRNMRVETSRPYTDSRDLADAMYSMIGLEYQAQTASEHRRQDLVLIDQLAAAVGRETAPIGQRAAIYATTYGLADPRAALLLQPMNLTQAQAQKAADFKKQFAAPGLKEMQVIASLMGKAE